MALAHGGAETKDACWQSLGLPWKSKVCGGLDHVHRLCTCLTGGSSMLWQLLSNGMLCELF